MPTKSSQRTKRKNEELTLSNKDEILTKRVKTVQEAKEELEKESIKKRGNTRNYESNSEIQKTGVRKANKSETKTSLENVKQNKKYVGAHCSIAGGVSNAVVEAASLGAGAFALFVRNGRTWKLSPLDPGEAQKFKAACKKHGYPPHLILPHGSYLLNCGSSNPETLAKSRDTIIHELQICEALGLSLYNFHPGSACGDGSVEECINRIAESINLAHENTSFVKTVIENMSCQGQTVGGKLEELGAIIEKVKDKSRVGVCVDTCHAFAAGFDLSSKEGYCKFFEDFDRVIGFKYLMALHLNDSKGVLGCHLDRHENIGKGQIGVEGFRRIMNDPRLANIPLILETPPKDYAKEIKLLCNMEK